MRESLSSAFISNALLYELSYESTRKAPLETGGCLLGYWEYPYSEVVITNAIGPGIHAVHEEYGFSPDHEWQLNEIDRFYQSSGRRITYLGDWHSHPEGNEILSNKDFKTLIRIGKYKKARAPVPIMAILHGLSLWDIVVWKYVPTTKFKLLRKGTLEKMDVKVIDY